MTGTVLKEKTIEGKWEEVAANAQDYAGHHVRLTVFLPEKSTTDLGIVPPTQGAGTYRDIVSLLAKEEATPENESLLEPILENRAMRRELAKEKQP